MATAYRSHRRSVTVIATFLFALIATILPSTIAAAEPVQASAAGSASSIVAAETGHAPAWSVNTVDGEHGQARANFSYDVNPGDTITDAIRVQNIGMGPLTLAVYAADAFTTQSGAIDILEKSETSVDAGTWVTLASESITLQPGESIDIPFTLTIPANATPGDHSAAIVASLLPGESTDQVNVERRLGLRVDLRVGGTLTPTAEIRNLTASYTDGGFNLFGGGIVAVSYELVNTGNVRLATLEDVRISGLGGSSAIALTNAEVPELLPGSSVTIQRELRSGALGPINGTLTLYLQPVGAFAEQPVALAQQFSTFASPWALITIIVILLIVIAAIIIVVLRRRRTRALLAAYEDMPDPDLEASIGETRRHHAVHTLVILAAAVVSAGLILAPATGAAATTIAQVQASESTPPPGNIEIIIPEATPGATPPPSTTPSSTTTQTPSDSPGAGKGPGNLATTGAPMTLLYVFFGVGLAGAGIALRTVRARGPRAGAR